jgi:ArsR family transcriptional regulator
MVQILSDSGEANCVDLTKHAGLAQSTVSEHLRVLKEAGLITDRPDGRWMYYSLNVEGIKELASFVNALQESRPSRRSCGPCR